MSFIDRYLQNRRRKTRKKPPAGSIYVTSIVKQCQRQAYFDLKRRITPSIDKLRMFEAGNILEDYLLKVYNEVEEIEVLGTQLPTYFYGDGFTVHGRLDILAQHQNSAIICHEVKSTQNVPYRAPWPDHIEQLQFYLGALGLRWGQIDYLDRRALVMGKYKIDTSYDVTFDRALFGNLVQRAQEFSQTIADSIVPPPNREAYGGKGCDNCGHRAHCDSVGELNGLYGEG